MKGIACRRPDGGLSLVWPSATLIARYRDPRGRLDQSAVIAHLRRRCLPPGAVVLGLVEQDSLPVERRFRDAWDVEAGTVAVDMTQAREIHLGLIRAARDRALMDLDSAYLRADEIGDADEKRRVAARKQALRELPQRLELDAIEDPAALAAHWPPELV